MLESLLNKVADFQACNFIRKRDSCNSFFYRAPPVAASVYCPKMIAFFFSWHVCTYRISPYELQIRKKQTIV